MESGHELANHSAGKNLAVNFLGGITLIVTIGVIVMLLLQLPDMLMLASRVSQ